MTLTAASPSGETGFLGVVMLDTRFPRPPGDVGHPDTFGVPVRQRVVRGAWPGTIVQTAEGLRAAGMAPAFVQAVQALEAEGARAITTSCGFLVLLQAELQAAARVPVITSSLLQLPGLLAHQPRVGVLTISAAALGPEHLLAAGVPVSRLDDVVVQGLEPTGEFVTAILGNRDTLDIEKARRDVVHAAVALKQREPLLQAVVLECTNLPPYRQAIEAATGLKAWALTDDERLLRPWR
ncbi:aspartate/glutamate racemase family protein [Polaromonas sp. LjRoot131]|uniref:aspartate/glutamate racemase family protein n=1 Tax=Polaromonas sp. LjRoot131 TaxID=3342262 RepID=UPI003ECD43E4